MMHTCSGTNSHNLAHRTECDIRGALVHVLVHGPALVPKRALLWTVPRLSPQDKVTHTVPLRLLGCVCVHVKRVCSRGAAGHSKL